MEPNAGAWKDGDGGYNIRKLIPLGALDDVVEDQDHAVVAAFEN